MSMSEVRADAGAPSARRTSVLESAIATFSRFGYRKSSMEDIASSALISRPGLYFLFGSKDELFRAAVLHALESDLADVERTVADTDQPLRARLLASFDSWAGRYVGPMSADVAVLVEDNPDLLGPAVQALPRRFEALIEQAIASQHRSAEASTAVTQTLISAAIGIKHQVSTREAYLERVRVAIRLLIE